nr:hypothetical protein [uncultured Methylobacterium sp.]
MTRSLAAILLLAIGTMPDSAQAGSNTCTIGGWSIVTEAGGVPVRAGPSPEAPIVGRLPPAVAYEGGLYSGRGPEFAIVEAEGGWFRIDAVYVPTVKDDDVEDVPLAVTGWIPGRAIYFQLQTAKGFSQQRSPSVALLRSSTGVFAWGWKRQSVQGVRRAPEMAARPAVDAGEGGGIVEGHGHQQAPALTLAVRDPAVIGIDDPAVRSDEAPDEGRIVAPVLSRWSRERSEAADGSASTLGRRGSKRRAGQGRARTDAGEGRADPKPEDRAPAYGQCSCRRVEAPSPSGSRENRRPATHSPSILENCKNPVMVAPRI